MHRLTAVCLLALTTGLATARDAAPDMARRTRELTGLRWGMFVCWSFSTFSGREWTGGVKDVAFFRATDVDTDQWARTAREAGMGYILFLAKHHDGFCLWDTRTTERRVTRAPLGRDVLAELRRSCDKYGIKLAIYFSEGDWTWPGAVDGAGGKGGSWPEQKKAQLCELLTGYGPIEYLWFDHAVGDGGLSHAETVAVCKSLQPGCFVGFNHGDQQGADIRLGEMGRPGPLADQSAAGPYAAAAASSYRLAEFTYPILPAHEGGAMWFYSLPRHDQLCRDAASLYADYLGAVRYGNVFALDVGPDYAGRLREVDVRTLRAVGKMIRAGATASKPPVPLSQGCRATASSVWNDPGYEPGKAVDGNDVSRWGAAPGSRAGWLAVDLGEPRLIGSVVVKELAYPRTQRFVIELSDDGVTWTTVARGTTLAGRREFELAPVEARWVRLNVLAASEVPTIEALEVYAPTRAPRASRASSLR